MKNRIISLLTALLIISSLFIFPAYSDDLQGDVLYMQADTGVDHYIASAGSYINWAGVSDVSQFRDNRYNFCFAVDGENSVTVYKTNHGKITDTLSIEKPYDLFGGMVCDSSGYLYAVFAFEDDGTNYDVDNVFVYKYTSSGQYISRAGANGDESMYSYYDQSFYTKIPFNSGNCDIALYGNMLAVNYAREMYSGHQSNSLFVIYTDTMTGTGKMYNYNSHSFDQRVSPYSKTGGFIATSHGDCYPRSFNTCIYSSSGLVNELDTFSFWTWENSLTEYNMWNINTTFAKLGNILQTGKGAALIGASVRSLSSDATEEPCDLFVQVFDPETGKYITTGDRTGLAGPDGNTATTDHGVVWLTDLEGTGKTVSEVQAIDIDSDTIVVLYEVSTATGKTSPVTRIVPSSFEESFYIVLGGDGRIKKQATSLGGTRLNKDEDPVCSMNTVQWVSNEGYNDDIILNCLYFAETVPQEDEELHIWGAVGHSLIDTVVGPTCTEQGYTEHKCPLCGYTYKDSYTDATGHNWGEWTVTQYPTDTEPGVATRKCLNDPSHVDIKILPVTCAMHDMEEITGTEAGCETEGAKTYYRCRICMGLFADKAGTKRIFSLDEIKIQPTGHSWGTPTYSWTEDHSSCTATSVCGNDPSHVLSETSASVISVISEPTLISEGTAEVTASFKNAVFGTQKITVTLPKKTFSDVRTGAYYYDPVYWAVGKGITNGTSDTTFSPDNKCTRGQIVTFLYRAAGSPEIGEVDNPFGDIKKSDYYYDAVLWAVSKGITKGMSANRFAPGEPCTRGQIVTFLYRYCGDGEEPDASNPFTDVKTGDYYYIPVMWASRHEITNGVSATKFAPSSACTRGQVVTFLYRAD